jgi:hypothetical protein
MSIRSTHNKKNYKKQIHMNRLDDHINGFDDYIKCNLKPLPANATPDEVEAYVYAINEMDFAMLKAITSVHEHPITSLLVIAHFNENWPEHHNVYCEDMKDNVCHVFINDKWTTMGTKETIDKIVKNMSVNVMDMYKQASSFASDEAKETFHWKMACVESNNSNNIVRKILERDIKEILVNNKEMVKKSRRRWEAQQKAQPFNALSDIKTILC